MEAVLYWPKIHKHIFSILYQDCQLIYQNITNLQIKLKIQNEKLNPLPDPFALDWDNLSETEMKRLVGQLEKTRTDLL